MSELPPGFVLDHTDAAIPQGFVLDTPSMGEDVAKSAGIGAVKGGIGMLGMGGDAGSLLSTGVDYAGSKLGAAPDKVQQFKDMAKSYLRSNPVTGLPAGILQGPSSQDLQSGLESITGPLYEPKTVPGQYAQTAGEFLPAMIGGPESLLSKALTRVAVPALASETAGQLTKGTGAEPYARVAGALVGGVGATAAAHKFTTMAAARQTASAIPSAEDTLKAAGQQFKSANDMNMVVTGNVPQDMAATMRANLRKEGFSPSGQKPVFDALDELHALGDSPAVMVNDIETIRKQLTQLKMNPDGATREAARRAINDLNAGKAGIDPSYVIRGDAPAYNKLISDAVGNYAAGKRSNTIMGKVDLADLNAGTAGSGANQDNTLRQAIKQLARPQNNTNVPVARKLGFNEAETAAIRQAATGTALGNTARYLGKYAPTGIVSAAGGAGLGHLIGGPVGAAIPAVGYIAKKIGDLSTKRAVAAVDSLVRSRSPLAAQVAAQLNPQIVSQLPAKSQRILQTMVSQPPIRSALSPQSQLPQQASRAAPSIATIPQAVAPKRSMPIPPQAPPIFVAPKSPPPSTPTASGDGQPSRPSTVGVNWNRRIEKYQDWTAGRIVKVGFVDGLKVEGIVPAVYKGDAPGFVLTKGDNVYRVTPHRGMEKLSTAEGEQALRDARQGSRS